MATLLISVAPVAEWLRMQIVSSQNESLSLTIDLAQNEWNNLSDDKWQGIKAASNEQRKLLEDIVADLRTYKDAGVHLQKWIAQKEKMVAVLGPVATEPSMIRNQLEQVKVCGYFWLSNIKESWFCKTIFKNKV